METKLEEAEQVQAKYEQQNLIEENKLSTLCYGQLYKKRIMQAHNKKVQLRQFEEGNLVLKKILPNQQDPIRKWTLNWKASYVVKKAFFERKLILTKMDVNELSSPINYDVVKKYHA